MAISDDLMRQAVDSLSRTDGLMMNPDSLVEDVFLLALAFPVEDDFMAACASTQRAFKHLIAEKVTASDLKYSFEEWSSYHYQHRVGQGIRATCRIMYRKIDGGIEVKGFGHRRIPADFYERMGEYRLSNGLN